MALRVKTKVIQIYFCFALVWWIHFQFSSDHSLFCCRYKGAKIYGSFLIFILYSFIEFISFPCWRFWWNLWKYILNYHDLVVVNAVSKITANQSMPCCWNIGSDTKILSKIFTQIFKNIECKTLILEILNAIKKWF